MNDALVDYVVDTLKDRAKELYDGEKPKAEDVAFVMELLAAIIKEQFGRL